jgi:anti-sigma regulatory factor (Ser/Thr protein kinase)
VTELRHTIASCATRAGLTGQRRDDFVVAVNELLTNAVRHGGGSGHVTLWSAPGEVVCEVTDRGHGMAGEWTSPTGRPAPDHPGGWGLWLAAELTDALEVHSDADGTAVRISAQVF